MFSNNFELSVLVNGRPVKEWYHNGRVFIEARKGTVYTLKLRNNSHLRGKAIFSVDGLDVIKGKPAEQTSSGYIIDAYSTIEIKGYRTSDKDVAEFVFADGKTSYASEMGDAKNNGVIGVRVIGEKEKVVNVTTPFYAPLIIQSLPGTVAPPYTFGAITGCAIPASYSSSAGGGTVMRSCNVDMSSSVGHPRNRTVYESDGLFSGPSFDLGTSWGKKIEDQVTKVEFEENGIAAQMELFYASRPSLEEMGIQFDSKKKIADFPQAFGEYCKAPKGYKA